MHRRRTRCQDCEKGFEQQLEQLARGMPLVRSTSRQSLTRNLATLGVFTALLPVTLAADAALVIICLWASEFWPLHATRHWWKVLRSKERVMWRRRKKELRRAFLEELPALLGDGA